MFPDIGRTSCVGGLRQGRRHLATKCDLWLSPAHGSYTWLFLLKAECWWIVKRYKRVFPDKL